MEVVKKTSPGAGPRVSATSQKKNTEPASRNGVNLSHAAPFFSSHCSLPVPWSVLESARSSGCCYSWCLLIRRLSGDPGTPHSRFRLNLIAGEQGTQPPTLSYLNAAFLYRSCVYEVFLDCFFMYGRRRKPRKGPGGLWYFPGCLLVSKCPSRSC